MNSVEISIITPTYNAQRFIDKTLNSVAVQSFSDYEHLIIDDNSSDSTCDIVTQYAQTDSRIHLIKLCTNGGAAIARNTGLSQAKGRYIAFIDSDDLWAADKLEKQLMFMQQANLAFSYTAYDIMDEVGLLLGKTIDLHATDTVNYHDMLCKRSTMGCSTVMLDTQQVGIPQMPPIRTGQDYGLWLKLLKAGHLAHCLREPLTHYRIVSGSISRNKAKKAKRQWQIYRQIENISLLPACWYFLNYAWRAFTR